MKLISQCTACEQLSEPENPSRKSLYKDEILRVLQVFGHLSHLRSTSFTMGDAKSQESSRLHLLTYAETALGRLPLELRELIYGYMLSDMSIVYGSPHSSPLSILITCTQTRQEVIALMKRTFTHLHQHILGSKPSHRPQRSESHASPLHEPAAQESWS